MRLGIRGEGNAKGNRRHQAHRIQDVEVVRLATRHQQHLAHHRAKGNNQRFGRKGPRNRGKGFQSGQVVGQW